MQEYKCIRQTKRIPYTEKVLINDSIPVRSNDISEGGLFVHTRRSLLLGSIVKVTFPSTGLTVNAVVQHPSPAGVGLMFTALDRKQAETISKLVRQAQENNKAHAIRKTRILLVEDCVQGIYCRSRLLADGFYVMKASSCTQAIKILRTHQVHAVVLLLQRVGKDIYDLLDYLKRSAKNTNIPSIVLSSQFAPEEQISLYEAGAEACLPLMTTAPAKVAETIREALKL